MEGQPHENLEAVVTRATALGASDLLLFHYLGGGMTVRVKIDGVWRQASEYGEADAKRMLNRMKTAAGIATGGLLTPVDKDWKPTIAGHEQVIRVAAHPAANGEKIALRLQWDGGTLPLDQLGMNPANLYEYEQLLAEPNGLIAHIGPVGSGKTVLQYAGLGHIAGTEKSVSTIEDPPERILPGVAHMAINIDAGATFPVWMKSMLRGSDDVLLVGEMRDSETALSVLQLAKAGTLILSTIHANDNLTAIERLVEFTGHSRSSVVEATRGLVSQRLLRRLHKDCNGNGCEGCGQIGYAGRIPVHEILTVNAQFERAVTDGANTYQLREIATEYRAAHNLPTLLQDAQRLVDEGITDEKETRRVLGRGRVE